jgi:hypothetical protein
MRGGVDSDDALRAPISLLVSLESLHPECLDHVRPVARLGFLINALNLPSRQWWSNSFPSPLVNLLRAQWAPADIPRTLQIIGSKPELIY